MLKIAAFLLVVAVTIGALMPARPVRPASASSIGAETSEPPRQLVAAATTPTIVDQAAGPDTVIDRSPDGHFYVDAQVNGAIVHFLVDTGATAVSLTPADAQSAGLSFNPAQFETVGTTASGALRGALVTLDRVSLGSRSASHVSAVVMEGGDRSLLGQSFLSQLSAVEIHGDRMVLR